MTLIPISLTASARARIADLTARKPGARGIILSIAKGKGCGGNEYKMDYMIDEKPGFDKIATEGAAALYVPVTDSFMMFGMTIDYTKDELDNEKFVFLNPNETGRCGCGASFSVGAQVSSASDKNGCG